MFMIADARSLHPSSIAGSLLCSPGQASSHLMLPHFCIPCHPQPADGMCWWMQGNSSKLWSVYRKQKPVVCAVWPCVCTVWYTVHLYCTGSAYSRLPTPVVLLFLPSVASWHSTRQHLWVCHLQKRQKLGNSKQWFSVYKLFKLIMWVIHMIVSEWEQVTLTKSELNTMEGWSKENVTPPFFLRLPCGRL